METRFTRGKSAILERSLAKLFSEMVQYCQSQVYSASGVLCVGLLDVLDVLVLREEWKRETKVLNILLFIKVSVWRALFGKDKLDGFPAKATVHRHKGTTLMIKFDEAVIARDKALEGR
uniref:Trafficking protein particle complex subunit 5 n=1 Tax=Oncorhynchus kisutch TaxID=8019 RepID=A0A8C7C4D4_ONCKI